MRIGETLNSLHGFATFTDFIKGAIAIGSAMLVVALYLLDGRYVQADELAKAIDTVQVAVFDRQIDDLRGRIRIVKRRLAREPTGSTTRLDLADDLDVLNDELQTAIENRSKVQSDEKRQ